MSKFDEVVERRATLSLKYDFAVERGKPEDVLPFWIADMDFRVPIKVQEKLKEAIEHGIFGYSEVKDDYNQVVINWFKKHFSYELQSEWLVKTPGVVFALNTAIRAFTNIGDSILIQQPVYYPFSKSIINNNRELINSSLVYEGGKYRIDFEDFEQKIIDNKVKMFVLCSPHNPVGRVYTKEELQRLGDICLEHNVLIVSDEIHCDITRDGYVHHLFPSVDDRFVENAVLFTAPSKTFNVAGLQISNIFVPNEELRNKFKREMEIVGFSQLNKLGLVGTKACYEYGEEWLAELKKYLEENLLFMKDYLEEKLPKVKLIEPEGTFLAWLDFAEIDLSDEEINDIIVYKAKLWLDEGNIFGREGEKFQRINYACPRVVLKECLDRLIEVFGEY